MKAILTTIIAGAVALGATADIAWLNSEYDFGTIREDAGPAHGHLSFVNTGTEPTLINNVKTSCGCTAARWPEGEIMPGDTAVIRFSYNPAGRPGRFEKTIRVSTGTDNKTDVLTIRGNVIGDSATLARMYPYGTGPLRMTETDIQLGNLDYGTPRNKFIYAYNTSEYPIVLSWNKLPKPITVGLSSDTIKPGETASLGIYYNSRDENEMGAHLYNLELNVSAHRMTYLIPLKVNVNLIPVVKLSAKQAADAGRISFEPSIAYAGEIKPGKTVKFKFKVTNEGKEPLDISRVYAASSDIRLKKYPRSIRPGASATIEGSFTPRKDANQGAFSHKITVLSSDPIHPVENVRLSGIILSKNKKQ